MRDFEVQHTKRLHLIVARRDIAQFQHLHPVMTPGGTWKTSIRWAQGASTEFSQTSRPEARSASSRRT